MTAVDRGDRGLGTGNAQVARGTIAVAGRDHREALAGDVHAGQHLGDRAIAPDRHDAVEFGGAAREFGGMARRRRRFNRRRESGVPGQHADGGA